MGDGPGSSSDMGFGKEMMLQSFEKMRVFRPRLLVHGQPDMGQSQIGAAMLQHLEGFHVQSLDVATLISDSARTPEAALIQLFVEAKRHKPSVLYIPGLIHWANTVPDSVRGTMKGLLQDLSPSDPVLLLGVSESPFESIPEDIRRWFGVWKESCVEIPRPNEVSAAMKSRATC